MCRLQSREGSYVAGTISEAVDIRQAVGIEIDYDVLESGINCCRTSTSGTRTAFRYSARSIWIPSGADVLARRGRYVSTGWIPGNFLNEGTVLVDVAVIVVEPFIGPDLRAEHCRVSGDWQPRRRHRTRRLDRADEAAWSGPSSTGPPNTRRRPHRFDRAPPDATNRMRAVVTTAMRSSWEPLVIVCLALTLRLLWRAHFMGGPGLTARDSCSWRIASRRATATPD